MTSVNEKLLPAQYRTRLGKVPDEQIADEVGLSHTVVANIRKKLNISPYAGPNTPAPSDEHEDSGRPFKGRRSALDEYVDVLGRIPDADVARMAGVTPENVRTYRVRREIPAAWLTAAPATLGAASRVDTPNGPLEQATRPPRVGRTRATPAADAPAAAVAPPLPSKKRGRPPSKPEQPARGRSDPRPQSQGALWEAAAPFDAASAPSSVPATGLEAAATNQPPAAESDPHAVVEPSLPPAVPTQDEHEREPPPLTQDAAPVHGAERSGDGERTKAADAAREAELAQGTDRAADPPHEAETAREAEAAQAPVTAHARAEPPMTPALDPHPAPGPALPPPERTPELVAPWPGPPSLPANGPGTVFLVVIESDHGARSYAVVARDIAQAATIAAQRAPSVHASAAIRSVQRVADLLPG